MTTLTLTTTFMPLRILTAILVLASSLLAQSQSFVLPGTASQYSWSRVIHTASATTDAVTIKHSTSDRRWGKIHTMVVYCSSACLVEVWAGGTAASTTCAVVTGSQESSSVSFLTQVCTASNAGAGTKEHGGCRLSGAGACPMGGEYIRLERNSAEQLTIRVTQGSAGTIDYYLYGEEMN